MSEFRLVIAADNEAFTEDPDNWTRDTDKRNAEVARILRHVADRIEYNTTGPTVDINGNTVGSFGFFAEVDLIVAALLPLVGFLVVLCLPDKNDPSESRWWGTTDAAKAQSLEDWAKTRYGPPPGHNG